MSKLSLFSSGGGVPASVRFARIGLPGLVFFGIAGLIFIVFGDSLRGGRALNTAPVLLLPVPEGLARSEPNITSTQAETLAQAAGWVEPAPYPLHVAAQTSGRIQKIYVLEGQTVSAGDLLAELDPADAQNLVNKITARSFSREKNVAVQRARLQGAEAQRTELQAALTASTARLDDVLDVQSRLLSLHAEDRSDREVLLAERDVLTRTAERDLAEAALAKQDALLLQLEAEAALALAEQRAAEAELEQAHLDLSRTQLLAPVSGRILRRRAEPGQWVTLSSEPLFSLYEPDRLQVRVDVPLADAAKIRPGMTVRLRSSMLAEESFSGTVDLITGEADLTRNTLQVKVRLENPPDALRPEMLCRAEFLASPSTETPETSAHGLWVPVEAVVDRTERGGAVWLLEPDSDRVQRVNITHHNIVEEGHLLLNEGPGPGRRVVLRPPEDLREGERIQLQKETP